MELIHTTYWVTLFDGTKVPWLYVDGPLLLVDKYTAHHTDYKVFVDGWLRKQKSFKVLRCSVKSGLQPSFITLWTQRLEATPPADTPQVWFMVWVRSLLSDPTQQDHSALVTILDYPDTVVGRLVKEQLPFILNRYTQVLRYELFLWGKGSTSSSYVAEILHRIKQIHPFCPDYIFPPEVTVSLSV
jgi:hypothetical protein